jgi:YgiT-type zinc finger domain-containing protein
MKCVICRYGETAPGNVTITLENDESILVIKKVPACVCQTCGEEYVDEETTSTLFHMAEETNQAGVQFVIRSYVAA